MQNAHFRKTKAPQRLKKFGQYCGKQPRCGKKPNGKFSVGATIAWK